MYICTRLKKIELTHQKIISPKREKLGCKFRVINN